jgi:hypothetical protein
MPEKIKESIATRAPFFDAFFDSSFYKGLVATLIAVFAVELRMLIEDKNSRIHKYIKQISKLEELKVHHKILFTFLITFIASIIVLILIFSYHYFKGKVIKFGNTYITPFY